MTVLRWLAPLLLAACAAPHAAGPAACDVRAVADIPVSREHGFISAPAQVDGKPVTLLIDTGAEATMLTPSAVASLHLGADLHRRTTINGAGGTLVSQNARLQSLAIGGFELLDQSAAVGPLPVATGAALHASGLLGADWLSVYDVEIDLPNHRIRLFSVHDCTGDYLPWSGPRTATPVQIYGRGLVLLPATLDDHPVRVLLDTGANRSTLSEAAAEAAGAPAAALARDAAGQSVGVDGTLRTVRQHRFETLRLAGLRTTGPVIGVGTLRLGFADMLLGSDWMQHVRVWISYANRRVTVQPG